MLPSTTKITKEGRINTDLYSDTVNSQREIWLGEEVTDASAEEIVIQLRHLDRTKGDIKLFINSPGGSVSAGMAIVDQMKLCKNDISTICLGRASSMAAFILSCGTKGKRYAGSLSEIMIHQPLGGAQGQATEILIAAEQIKKTRERINRILSENTSQPMEKVAADCERDYFMDADEAVKYGICDGIYEGEKA